MAQPLFGDHDTLTEALHAMVMESRRSKEIAGCVGKNYPVLLNELNPFNESNKLGADLVLPLMIAAGDDRPLRWLCARMNRACIPLPRPGAGPGNADRRAVVAVEEFGDVMRAYNAALEDDGQVDRAERERIRREAHEAVSAILGFALSLDPDREEG